MVEPLYRIAAFASCPLYRIRTSSHVGPRAIHVSLGQPVISDFIWLVSKEE